MTTPPADLRCVRRLHLRAESHGQVRRGRILVEEALRIASLPGAGSRRVVFIRSIKLGTLRRNTTSPGVALAIQEQLGRMSGVLVHVEDPRAPAAPAVFFDDDVQPSMVLVQRLAGGKPVEGWFWPAAVPGYRRGAGRRENLRAALAHIALQPCAPAALVALAGELPGSALRRHDRSIGGAARGSTCWRRWPEGGKLRALPGRRRKFSRTRRPMTSPLGTTIPSTVRWSGGAGGCPLTLPKFYFWPRW